MHLKCGCALYLLWEVSLRLLILVLSFITLQLGWGIDSVLWLQAIFALVNAIVFVLWQFPLLLTRGATYTQPMKPVMRVGISAWLTNVVSLEHYSSKYLSSYSPILRSRWRRSPTSIFLFSWDTQPASSCFGIWWSCWISACRCICGNDLERLARTWQTLLKVETLLQPQY